MVFTLPTIGLIARNREFFDGNYSAGRDLYLLGVLTIVIGFGLWAVSRWPVGRFLWTSHVLITPGWFVYSAIGNRGRVFAAAAVTVSILIVAWIAVRSERGFTRGIELVSVMLLIGLIATTLIQTQTSAAEPAEAAQDESVSVTVSPDPSPPDSAAESPNRAPNVYHLVLDEYQTEMFDVALDRELEDALAGFTYFPLARTGYGRTEMSMASILGADDYDYSTSPREFVEASLRSPSSNLNVLRRADYQTAGYSHLASLYGTPSPFDHSRLHADFVDVEAGAGSSDLINSLWLYSNTPSELAERLLSQDDYSALAGENLLPDDAPPISVWAMEKFVALERSLPGSGRYSLVHLILPHFPYVLSPSCEYQEGKETSPVEQTSCANSLIISLIDELKRLDRFDSSVIVIHGDHGARFQRDGAELRQVPQDFLGETWNNARSKPLLLIKPAGVTADGPLHRSEFPALLTDIMPTVMDSLGISDNPHRGRVSLLDPQLPDRESRYYHFYDKDSEGLPDGELMRFIASTESLAFDRVIALPADSGG